VSGRLRLRRGVVAGEDPLIVEVDGERRLAWADESLLGEMRAGDEVVVNVAALDLGLGSGGFDVVHVNLTRGLAAEPPGDEHVMKLNYTSLQHAIDPIEGPLDESAEKGRPGPAVLVLPLHGHLAPAVWAAKQVEPGLTIGYVQTGGGALPGSLSRDAMDLRERGLLAGHVTVAPAYGGEHEALSVPGAIDAAARELGWDAAIAGPGPGIIGSETELGHGGIAALDSAHAALALGFRTVISPRLSSGDPRERHRPLSHHTSTVLRMLLAPVEIAVPAGDPVAAATLAQAAGWRHRLREAPADIAGYAASGLPARTMGRTIEEDPLFFAAALAAGTALRDKG
jgi:Protein of unknown function (DUF3866)